MNINDLSVDQLRNKIIAEFSYLWQVNDAAHRIEHFKAVEECGNFINEIMGLKQDPKLIMLAAFFHDMFAFSRVNHHELSCHYIMTTDNPIITHLTDSQRHILSIACKHHRASFKGKFIYTLDELINSADRGFPSKDVTSLVERSLLCSLAKTEDPYKAASLTYDHMKEKYGTGGYARYPAFYNLTFGRTLIEQQQNIDALTLEAVVKILLKFKPEFKYHEAKPYKHIVEGKESIPASDLINDVKTESRYYVDANRCDCHPETCCCDDYAVYDRGAGLLRGSVVKKVTTAFTQATANEIAAAFNKSHEADGKPQYNVDIVNGKLS